VSPDPGASLEGLSAPLAIAGGVDDDPLALAQAAKGRLVAEQLQGVDRLAPFADQEAVVVTAPDRDRDPVVVLDNLDLAVEIELVEHALDQLAGAIGRAVWPVGGLGHASRLSDLPPICADN